ncbi:unnamed protein product, partial [Phaeothamnion confervicola]
TETVYGLGANALDAAAVLSIFHAKQRPLTDPVIVHVSDAAAALELLQLGTASTEASENHAAGEHGANTPENEARCLFLYLASRFWPGPLTMIAKAAPAVPACVTASTGFVGVRCPRHPVALRMLELAQVPVAAPSANRFGHISPTSARHVLADLSHADILVVDGDACHACAIGIESTVARIDGGGCDGGGSSGGGSVSILRRGAVTEEDLRTALVQGGFGHVVVRTEDQAHAEPDLDSAAAVDGERDGNTASMAVAAAEEEAAPGTGLQAPGQLLRHYAPDLDTFRVAVGTANGNIGSSNKDSSSSGGDDGGRTATALAAGGVVIDFAGQLSNL